MADHSFDPEIAQEVGMIAAVLYRNIQHWCEHNRTNNKHIHEEKAWTYNSVRAWKEQYPYLSEKQVRTALLRLEEAGFIAVGEFNKDNRDRTKWYCDLRNSICPTGKMQLPQRATPTLAREGKPLPDIKPINLQKINKKGSRFQEFWDAFADKRGRDGAERVWKRKRLDNVADEVIAGAVRYTKTRGDNRQYWKQAQGWLNDGRWNDEAPSAQPASNQSNGKRGRYVAGFGFLEEVN